MVGFLGFFLPFAKPDRPARGAPPRIIPFAFIFMIEPPSAANVLTFVGLPPTPCFFARFRLTAEATSFFDILAALAAGTHFG